MQLATAYRNRSAITRSTAGLAVSLAPNLRRDRVSFVGTLREPLRFREAVSALHDVVISDLRYKPKDKSAYEVYKKRMVEREAEIRKLAQARTREELKQEHVEPITPEFRKLFESHRNRYWKARQKYSDHISVHDPKAWRLLMPCDPVITVSPDVLFFECFSADESSYGCLTVERDAFAAEQDVSLGTTNVDYSWRLYEHFQEIRSYRETRFTIDPMGFEVQTNEATPGYREEKIDLPQSWLRGFMTLQSAMSFPMRRVPVSREGVYNILAFLKRHKSRKSPRAVRFELNPGKPVEIVLEPWEERFVLHNTPYPGAQAEVIRTWGRDRLRVLARMLPLLDGADVYLLGTGLPSFWVMRMGEMKLTLGLSGWTANDWTSGGGAIDQLLPPLEPSKDLMNDIAEAFREKVTWTLTELVQRTGGAPAPLVAGLNRLALFGQVIHDLPNGVYRWRQIMPVTLSAEQVSPDNPETLDAREIVKKKGVTISKDKRTADGSREIQGKAAGHTCELTINSDGRIVKGKCGCSFFYTGGLRKGPCRHLQALRNTAIRGGAPTNLEAWYKRIMNNLDNEQ